LLKVAGIAVAAGILGATPATLAGLIETIGPVIRVSATKKTCSYGAPGKPMPFGTSARSSARTATYSA
jgi:hypothetical protein